MRHSSARMLRRCGTLAGVLLLAATAHASARTPAAAGGDPLSPPHRDLVRSYCVTCHNERRQVGGLALDAIADQPLAAHADTWEHVIRKLRVGAMPPSGMPRPQRTAAVGLVKELEGALDRAAER